jgi:crotonobetainyl-CoA:carnitine CoA-transferase CaiB-like acyl-CoA transferase
MFCMSVVQDVRQALQDTLAAEIRELKARLAALESRMDRNEAAAERRHAGVLTTIRDAMEITHIRERLARLEAEREPKLQHPA